MNIVGYNKGKRSLVYMMYKMETNYNTPQWKRKVNQKQTKEFYYTLGNLKRRFKSSMAERMIG